MITPTIPFDKLWPYWHYDTNNLKAGPQATPGSRCSFGNINDISGEIMGSNTWRRSMRGLESGLNNQKGFLMFIGPNGDRRNPAAQEEMLRNTERSVIAGTGEEEWLEPMRTVCSTLSLAG